MTEFYPDLPLDDTEIEERFDEASHIQAAREGDEDAFKALYNYHRGHIFHALRRKSNDNFTLAEDLTQETFINMFRSLDKFEDQGKGLAPWLHRIAANLFLNDRLKQKRQLRTSSLDTMEPWVLDAKLRSASEAKTPEDVILIKDDLGGVLAAIKENKINEGILTVWSAVTLEERTNTEVQEEYGLAKGTVLSRLSRGRHAIQKLALEGVIEAPEDATFGLKQSA
jgi:RNA polymerase sigma factor (sigma-70 family)